MADDSQPPDANGLPPLAQIPQDSTTIPPEAMGQLEHAAEWAQTFGGSDTNLALRARHNADINAYAQGLQSQREAAQANLIQTNRTAQNLYLGSQRLDMQEQVAQANMAHADAMAPLNQAAKIAQTNAANAREAATTQSSLLQAQHDQIASNDTLGFAQSLQNIHPNAPEFKNATVQGILKYPNASKELQSAMLKSAGIELSPDDIAQQYKDIQAKMPGAKIAVGPKGIISATMPAPPSSILSPAQNRQALSDQMKDDRLRDSEIERQLGDITTANPILSKTTGPFIDANGKQRWGSVDQTEENSAVATPQQLAAYDQVKALLAERNIIQGRHQALQQKMTELYTNPGATVKPGAPTAPDSPQNEMIKQAYKAGPGANDPDGNGFAAYAAQTQGTHFNTPAEYSAAFKAAPSGAVLHYQGKAFKKP